METELKFSLSPEARDRIERYAEALPSDGRSSTEAQSTIYFDTPRRKVRKGGFSLRVRQSAGKFVQTVKSAGNGSFRRQEWEWPVASDRPDLQRLAEVPQLRPIAYRGLEPVFRTDIERTRLVLRPASKTKIELAIGVGTVTAGDASESVSELELELKGGEIDALFRLGLELLEVAPLVVAGESNAQRGYRLRDGTRPAVHKPKQVDLHRTIQVREAFARLSGALLDDLLANQPAVLGGDEVEGIHRMRIGIRRLRSLLVLFEPCLEAQAASRFTDELRRLGRVLGVARDWDVFLAETLPAATVTPADRKTIEPLRAAAMERQHDAHQAAKKAVQEPSFTRFILAFGAWSHDTEGAMPGRGPRRLKEIAPKMLDRLARKVRKRQGAIDPEALATLHALRKSAKKLRYAIEYFDGLYGKKSRRYYKRYAALQKRLGELNDLATLQRLSQELAAEHLEWVPALAVLQNHSGALMAQALDRLQRPLARAQREKAFW